MHVSYVISSCGKTNISHSAVIWWLIILLVSNIMWVGVTLSRFSQFPKTVPISVWFIHHKAKCNLSWVIGEICLVDIRFSFGTFDLWILEIFGKNSCSLRARNNIVVSFTLTPPHSLFAHFDWNSISSWFHSQTAYNFLSEMEKREPRTSNNQIETQP